MKKLMLSLLAMVGLCSVAYAYYNMEMDAATDISSAKTIWDKEIISGDIVAYGKYKDCNNLTHDLTWRVLTVTDSELVMITEEVIDTINGDSSSSEKSLKLMDQFMDEFNQTNFILDTKETLAVLTPAWIMTKSEVYGGDDAVFDNPNTSIYFKNNSERATKGSLWAHRAGSAPAVNSGYWSLHTAKEDSRNKLIVVYLDGEINLYTTWSTIGLRPSIKVKRKNTTLEPLIKDEEGNVKVRAGEESALIGSVLGNLDSNGQGTIQYAISGDSQYLELVEDPEDNTKATIKVKQDLKEGTYALQVTTKDDEGDIATVTLNVTVLKAYPIIDDLQFIPSETITPDATTEDILGIASLNGISDTSQIKTEYSVDEASFTIENTSNLNLQMDSVTGKLTFKNALDPGKHTFDVVITLKENGVITKTIKKANCFIMVDMELVPEFTGITDPMIYNGILNGQSYTKKDNQIGVLSVKGVNDSDVTSYQIVSGGNGSLFKIDQKNKVYNTENLNAGTYTINLDITAKGITKQGTVTFKIEKAIPDISFKDDKTTKKSISDATNKWSEQASTSTFGTKITYAVSAGDVSLIDIDSDSGEITYKGEDAFGSVKIKAAIDDDPTNDLDNYESSTVEKEIIIYREVGGYVQPDSKSSNIKDPTFTAADGNIKSGGTIGMIIGESGTPDTIGGSTTTYTYDIDDTSTNANFFTVDKKSGKIQTTANLSTGTYNIIVTVSDKWSTKNIPVTINVGMAAAEDLKFYEDSSASKAITKKSVAFTDKNVEVYAVVKDSNVANKVKYSIEDNSTNVITVNENTGAVEIKGVGKVTVVAKKAGASGQAEAVAKLEFEVTVGSFDFKYIDEAGDELGKTGDKYNAYKETYAKTKTFHIYTGGNPVGTTVSYDLKDKTEMMSDVISVDPDSGEVTILNASKTNQMGKIVIIATAHDPSGTYSDQSIELPITIEKGTRVVSFADDPIYAASGKSSITPVIHVDGIPETEGKALISINDTETDGTAWTDDNKTIKYEYNSEEPKDIKLKVTLPADRNYTIAEAPGTLHILGADENVLAITTPGRIIYGDNFTIRSTQDDSGSENVQYTFEVDDTTYVTTPTVTGKEAVFDALKASGTNTITVTVTRTADGEVPLSKKVNIKVLPKPIEITIDHKEKLKGETNPELTYQDFSKQLVSWNNVQDVIQPNDIKLSTTAKETSNASDYPIKGDSATLNKAYPNYTFIFKENTLTITEENIEDDWYHLELDDGNNTTYTRTWTNQDVNIISDHTDYKHISKDQSTWETPQVTVSTEGKTEQSFWLKKDSGAITSEKKETILIDKTAPAIKTITATDTNNKLQNIINQLTGGIFFKPGTAFEITTSDAVDDLDTSGTVSIDYKIYKQNDDQTYGSPIKQDTLTVTNEKAKVTIADTTGTYKICVLPKDKAGNVPEQEICKELTLKKIDVDIDGDGNDDFNDSDGDGCPDLNIKWKDPADDKKWIIVNGDRDHDGIPDLNIDSDGDGKVDLNIDTDNDGKPDLNLVILKKTDSQGTPSVWKPTKCVLKDESKGILEEYCTGASVKAQINVDTGTDNIPDINIDNIGDFKPHLNISSDGKTPSVNIVKLHEWKPNKDCASTNFSYDSIGTGKDDPKPELNIDTDNDGRPDINLDLNGDGTPELNIDGDGDGIPDVNIDATGNGEPDYNIDVSGNGYAEENIIKLTEWKPEKNVDKPFAYDTMEIVGKNQVEDGGVIVVDPGGNFLPNHAIKVADITDQLDEETKQEIVDQAGEQEVKTVYDVKFLEDNVETQPNGSVKVKVPVDSNIKNPKLIVEQKDGSYKVVEGTYEDGYLTYETDYVGKVSVIGDQEDQGIDEPKDDPKDPEPPTEPTDPEPTPEEPEPTQKEPKPTKEEPKPTVQGTYIPSSNNSLGNNMGGVSTGDTSNISIYLAIGFVSLGILFLLQFHKSKKKSDL